MADTDYYPPWLADALLSDTLPWERAARIRLSDFLAAYTLHDSEWINFSLDPIYDGGAVAVIRWDTIWTDGRVAFPGSFVADWPLLFLRFHRVHRASQDGYESGSPVPTRGIGSAECRPAGDVSRVITVIADHYGAQLEIEHAPEVDVLCLDRAGAVVPVPGFGAA